MPKSRRGDDDAGRGTHYRLGEPKSDRGRRTVTMPKVVVAALKAHRTRQEWEHRVAGGAWDSTLNLVFTTTIGTPLDSRNVLRQFQALVAQAGLPPMRFHDLRHSAATLMGVQGVPMRVAMDILGHSQIAITMNLYTHVIKEQGQAAADRIDDLFAASVGA